MGGKGTFVRVLFLLLGLLVVSTLGDVLKGANGRDLIRTKRYIGRVPVAYMKKNLQEYGYADRPQPSYFRENPHGRPIPELEAEDPLTSRMTDEQLRGLLEYLYLHPSQPRHRQAESPYDQLEFLGGGSRSKRTGARHLMKARSVSETSPSNLDKVFGETKMQDKPKKKSIDWSNYWGVDKRTAHNNPIHAPLAPVPLKGHPLPPVAVPKKLVHVPLTSTASKAGKESSKKKEADRKENETEDKTPDKDWVMHEFYKNFAMMTNVKRKRESPAMPANDLQRLGELEQSMTQVGDKIIWDALKYTGAHRDDQLTPEELAKVKASVVDKLATAYSLEKLKEAVEDLRAKLATLEHQQQAM